MDCFRLAKRNCRFDSQNEKPGLAFTFSSSLLSLVLQELFRKGNNKLKQRLGTMFDIVTRPPRLIQDAKQQKRNASRRNRSANKYGKTRVFKKREVAFQKMKRMIKAGKNMTLPDPRGGWIQLPNEVVNGVSFRVDFHPRGPITDFNFSFQGYVVDSRIKAERFAIAYQTVNFIDVYVTLVAAGVPINQQSVETVRSAKAVKAIMESIAQDNGTSMQDLVHHGHMGVIFPVI